jgi:signal recognition particle subunit SRP54
MFESLTQRLDSIFQKLRKRGKLSEADVDAVMREVRLALLEADVHYSVVKDFINRLRERAVGVEVSQALNPAQQVIKIVNEELIRTLGEPSRLDLTGEKPWVIALVGLQGSGKTTAAVKLAKLLKEQGERVTLVAADPYRPAAIKQLQTLGEKIEVPVFSQENISPPDLVKRAFDQASKGGYSVVIVDTAGRSQIDDSLMNELSAIGKKTPLKETLLVVDAMIGQEAIHVAEGFRKAISITGLIFTKMDGDARGGAAISIRSVTQVPIKYIGVGEGLDALEIFSPERMSSRILGMGDMLGLIQKAEKAFDQKSSEEQSRKLMRGQFTLEDFADQIKQIKKMGSLSQVMDMMPGNMGQAARQMDPNAAEKQMKSTEAILSSMTVQEINRLLKQFKDMQRLMKTMQKTGGRGMPKIFG